MDKPKIVCGTVIIDGHLYDKRVLTLFKNKYQRYEFPGGKIEPGETVSEAALRETREEIGCDVRLVGQYTSPRAFETPSGPKELHLFRAELLGKPVVAEPTKFSEIFYMPIREYEKYPTASYVQQFCDEYLNEELILINL